MYNFILFIILNQNGQNGLIYRLKDEISNNILALKYKSLISTIEYSFKKKLDLIN